jgi:fructoselysine-6-P-deglycase FrlB-like protein
MPIADTRREVAGQPAVIAGVLENLRNSVREVAVTLAKRATRQLFVLGSGDSWFAGQAARLALEHYAGLPTEPLQAYEYAAYGHPGFEAHSAAIVISSSGRPTTTWDALGSVTSVTRAIPSSKSHRRPSFQVLRKRAYRPKPRQPP